MKLFAYICNRLKPNNITKQIITKMKTKIFTLLLNKSLLSKLALIVLLLIGGGNCAWGDELTVYGSATSTSSTVPFDAKQLGANFVKSEFVIPSSELTDMAGKQISKLAFHIKTAATASWEDARFQVFLKEVDDLFLTSLTGTNGATVVYEGELDGTGSTMEVSFDTPYNYVGKNLLVGVYCTTKGTASSSYVYFYGMFDNNLVGYPAAFYSSYNNTAKFIPKTTFTYSSSDSYNLHLNSLTSSTASFSWNEDGKSAWQIAYSNDLDFTPGSTGTTIDVNTNSFIITELTPETSYYVCVRSKLGEDTYGNWGNKMRFTPSYTMDVLVNDGSNTNTYVIVPNSTNTGTRSQFIIPLAKLAKMQNRQITKLTFFTNQSSISWTDATFDVYVDEVESFDYYPSYSVSFKNWGTKVCSAKTFMVSAGKLEIEFDVPFDYANGNLIIGFDQMANTTSGSVSSTWYGVQESTDRTSVYYYYSGSGYYTTSALFSPKVSISSSKITTTLGANGFTTFACPRPLDLTIANMPDGLKAYKATVDGSKVRFTEIDQTVSANTGVLLKGTAGETYNIPVADSGTAVDGNEFLVNSTGGTFGADPGYTYFAAKKNSNPLLFATFNPSTLALPTNKAYLKVADAAAHSLSCWFDDETTGISSINNESLTIDNGAFYNLNGQRVTTPQKGLYIVNGKKFINK